MDDRNWRALFAHTGYGDKLPVRLRWHWLGPGSTETIVCIDSVNPSWKINMEDDMHTTASLVQLALASSCTHLHDSQLTSTVEGRCVLYRSASRLRHNYPVPEV